MPGVQLRCFPRIGRGEPGAPGRRPGLRAQRWPAAQQHGQALRARGTTAWPSAENPPGSARPCARPAARAEASAEAPGVQPRGSALRSRPRPGRVPRRDARCGAIDTTLSVTIRVRFASRILRSRRAPTCLEPVRSSVYLRYAARLRLADQISHSVRFSSHSHRFHRFSSQLIAWMTDRVGRASPCG